MFDPLPPEPPALTPKARAILDAASELFYENGIHAVGVDTISEHAGVTKKTLYDRFGSKDRLVVAYLNERDRLWRGFLADHRTAAAASPSAQVAAVFTAASEWSRTRAPRGCATINARAEITSPEHPAYDVIIEQKRWMLDLFRGLAADAGVDDPSLVADRIMLLHEGAQVSAGFGTIADPFAEAGAAAVELLR
ncbi:TetR/AcrR family transcriptional regulator [Gordonia soli]|uniref:Putative TetR family transcriptional regulator n=1 Tax=Gordonia soli NBRC 108243 TaxID=1223545 RepID=M0QG24_9ACTN|nr:TetR/AcrR family transcriptional regulator [Gordonia soli]GAC67575.1 putative TetR family transcriptional regulator [Gordonia soli NBRC 108243]